MNIFLLQAPDFYLRMMQATTIRGLLRGFLDPLRIHGGGGCHRYPVRMVMRQQRASLRVEATQTPNEDALKLTILEDRPLLPRNMSPVTISRKRAAQAGALPAGLSGIVTDLLSVKHVEGVFLGEGFLTVTKASNVEWDTLTGELLQVLERAPLPVIADDDDALPSAPSLSVSSPPAAQGEEGDVVQEIKELLEEKVRPYIQADGGDLHFVRFDAERGVVHLAMMGACASCASSTVTLKFMVRNLLCHYFEGTVQDVESVDLESEDDCFATGSSSGAEEAKHQR